MLKISYAGCPGLSPAILAQFTLKMCAAAENCKNKTLTPSNLTLQGHSRSFRSSMLHRSKACHSACYDKQHVCAYLQLFSR